MIAKGGDKEKILKCLKKMNGGTFEQVAIMLKWTNAKKAGRRLSELKKSNLVIDTGVKKMTNRGKLATVYEITNKKRKYVQYKRTEQKPINSLFKNLIYGEN